MSTLNFLICSNTIQRISFLRCVPRIFVSGESTLPLQVSYYIIILRTFLRHQCRHPLVAKTSHLAPEIVLDDLNFLLLLNEFKNKPPSDWLHAHAAQVIAAINGGECLLKTSNKTCLDITKSTCIYKVEHYGWLLQTLLIIVFFLASDHIYIYTSIYMLAESKVHWLKNSVTSH